MRLHLGWTANSRGTLARAVRGDSFQTGDLLVKLRSCRWRYKRLPSIDRETLDAELLRIVSEVSGIAPASSAAVNEMDVRRIVRPELVHTDKVSGVAVPVATMGPEGPAGSNRKGWPG